MNISQVLHIISTWLPNSITIFKTESLFASESIFFCFGYHNLISQAIHSPIPYSYLGTFAKFENILQRKHDSKFNSAQQYDEIHPPQPMRADNSHLPPTTPQHQLHEMTSPTVQIFNLISCNSFKSSNSLNFFKFITEHEAPVWPRARPLLSISTPVINSCY